MNSPNASLHPLGHMRACCLACVCAAILLASPAAAQRHPLFEHLTVNEGLSQGSVTCIMQDRLGFIWFGTQDGLNRFDGYTIRLYRNTPGDSTSLTENFVTTLVEDRNGTLWVGTVSDDAVLNRFDPLTESFTRFRRDSIDLRDSRTNTVNAEYTEPSGVRWTGSLRAGLKRVDPSTGTTTRFKHDPKNPESLISNDVYSIFGDRAGNLWFGTREGLERFNRETETFIHFRHDPKNPGSLSSNWVWPIFEDRSGILWIGTFGGGLNRFDRVRNTFTSYKNDTYERRSLAQDQIYSIYQDASGVIWVGTADRGVDRFHPDLGAFNHYNNNPTDPTSLVDNMIKSLHVDRSGTVWVGTMSGLARLDHTSDSFTTFTHDPSNPRSIVDNRVQTIYEDRSGVLWLGMYASGLDRLDRRTGTFTHFRNDPKSPHSLSDNAVYSLLEDSKGEFWVGTYGGGLNLMDRSRRTFTAFIPNDSIHGSLSGWGVWALCEDHEGTLWVGTSGGGLNRFNRETKTFTHYKPIPGDTTSLSDPLVLTIHEDRRGTLWVGTAAGLNRFNRATGTFRQYHQKEGLSNDLILGILEDGKGRLWISTSKGLSRFDPETETFRNFFYRDGLQGDEFNQNAYARNPVTGEMYFGGGNGFNEFHPDSVKDNPYVPPMVFSAFRRYNTDDEEGKAIEEKGIPVRRNITLSYKDNLAIFQFAALSFYDPARNRYAYKLEGYSENWIQLGSDHVATFTNLDGGDYTLRVRGSNNDGVWNEEGATLHLTVTPPWWKSRWAYVAYVFLAIGFLYGFRQFEINQREQKARMRESELHAKAVEAEKRALEAENERKTKELEDARKLQLSMLPKEIPKYPGYDIAVHMKTATEVGGDYYDFSIGEGSTLNIAFGDATGHGMQAGTIVTLMKGLFLSDASRFDITTFFNHCSRAMKDIRLGRLFMAFTLVRLKGNCVSLSSAGMPPAFLHRRSDGGIEEILLKGMPLGAMKNFPYLLHETTMTPGDTLLLLTDGLPEQKNGSDEMFDYAQVQQVFVDSVAGSPESIITRLVGAGESWMNGVAQDDDITLLVIRKTDGAVPA